MNTNTNTREARAERERKFSGGFYGSGVGVTLAFVALLAVVEVITRLLF